MKIRIPDPSQEKIQRAIGLALGWSVIFILFLAAGSGVVVAVKLLISVLLHR